MKLPKFNIRKLKGFLYEHRLSAAIVFVAVVVAIGATWYGLTQNVSVNLGTLKLKPKVVVDNSVESPLSGEKVDPAKVARRAIAVVIENYPDARPQSGYNEADLVYETLAEGGITRTLAIFHSKDTTEVGPVRSARSYFVDWALDLNALFAHVGGNADALDLVRTVGISDLNQFYNGTYFWRSSDRYAPHNVYTTTAKLFEAARANGYDTTKSPGKFATFKDDAKVKDRPAAQKVGIDFSSNDFYVTYDYDAKTNTYLRNVGGAKSVDKNTGIQNAPKNVIAILTDVTPFVNYAGEDGVHVGDVGSGTGFLFEDGKQIAINWSKSSRTATTKFTDGSGAEVKLNRGQTWIEVVPTGRTITSS